MAKRAPCAAIAAIRAETENPVPTRSSCAAACRESVARRGGGWLVRATAVNSARRARSPPTSDQGPNPCIASAIATSP